MTGKRLDIKYKEVVGGVAVEKLRYSVEKWQADDKYMGESFITFTVKSDKPIGFNVGDYCEYRGETYTLNYVPSVSQKGNVGDSGDSFVYDSVKMDSVREELSRIIMLDITPTTGDYVPDKGTNYTGSAQFQLYCGESSVNGKTRTPVCTLAGKIQANLDRAYPGKGWKVLVDTESTHTEAGEEVLNTHSDEKVLSFDNTTVSAALAEVKNSFDIDYAIKGRTIYIGYTFGSITGSGSDYYYFGYGKGYLSEDNQGKALFELKRNADSNQKIVTRLRALGSTKNMPYRYYNKKYNLSQSMFPTNLQLPDTFEPPSVKAANNLSRKSMYPWIRDVLGETNDAYIDKNDNCMETVEGLREECMRWDGSNSDLKEIYPSIEEVTYRELRGAMCEDMEGNKGASSFANYLDSERVDEILEVGDNANVGDGILPESDTSRTTANDVEVNLSVSGEKSSLHPIDGGYASKEHTVMSLSSQYAGEYIITSSHLWFGASYSLGRHQSENITKTCNVAYRMRVYAKPSGSSKENIICEYLSDFKNISNRDEEEYETTIKNIPDEGEGTPKVSKIELTSTSDIRITFALVVKNLDYSYDQYTLSWRVGPSIYNSTETDTEWTSSLIWDLKGSASTLMKNPFQVYVKDMGFDFVAQFSTSEEPRISMKTGMCVAREFKIGNNPEKVKIKKDGKTYNAWKLTLAKAEDPDLKTYYPSENFPLSPGDKFVVLGIEMPDVYIEAASMKLLVEATKALSDVCDTKHEYEPSVDDIYLQRNYERCEEEGDVTKSVYWKLASGMKFPFFGIRESVNETPSTFTMIIDTLSIREGDSLTPKVTIKLSEDSQQSPIQKLTRAVESISKSSIFNSTSISNNGVDEATVKSIISDFAGKRYLSKLSVDTAKGLITFLQGLVSNGAITAKDSIIIGNYVKSALWDGNGGCIDKDGNAWLRNLTLAESLTVPKLSYNFVEICPGIRWQSAGGGTIKSVEVETDGEGNPTINGTITLDLKEGEIGQIAVGDLCMGVFHSMFDQAINATEDYDSGTGVMTRAGFYTCYFRITDILDTQYNSKARYVLRSDDKWPHSYHPSAQMVFAAYGNPLVKARQTSAYHANSYTRYLRDVTTWEFEAYNIAMQMGDLSNLGIFGYNTGGYSAFLNNVYVTGHIEEITDTRTYVHVAGLEDSHIEVGGSREVKMWLERANRNYHDAEWTVTRESGLPEADVEWNEAHKSVSSPLTLTSEDMGEGAYLQAVMFTFTGRKTITDDVTGNPISFEGSSSAMLTLISREDLWIDFTCEKGKTFSVLYNDVDIKVTAHLMYGNTDITNDILLRSSSTMKWKRDSEIPSADLVWTPTTDAKGNTLHVVDKPDVRHDCGDNWATSLRVTFIFECTVIFGAEIIPLSGEVTIG